MSKVTQSDIAQALGLSPTTVGLVVGAVDSPLRKRLSEETVRRVQEKAAEMGYLPNRAAQMVRRGRSNLIVLLSMSGHSEPGSRSANQIGRLAHEGGFDFQIVDAYWWTGNGKRILEQVIALRPEGVIITGSSQTEINLGESLIKAGLRVIGIGYTAPGAPLIRYDARKAFRELTLAAIASGRRSPALFLPNLTENWNCKERWLGFLDAVEEVGWEPPLQFSFGEVLPVIKEKQARVYLSSEGSMPLQPFAPGMNAAPWFIGQSDALICSNDYYAFGVMTYYVQNGVSIPEQVSISGFDNLSFSSQGVTPLTTVEQPIQEMCAATMDLMLRWIGGKRPTYQEQVYPCKVIWRQSMPQPQPLVNCNETFPSSHLKPSTGCVHAGSNPP